MKYYAGIDIGGGSIKGSLISEDGKLFSEYTAPTNKFWNNQEFIEATAAVIKKLSSAYHLDAIGIGSPGPLDLDKGQVIHSTNLPNLSNANIVSSIAKIFPVPVFLNNDANCAALGEYFFGSYQKEHSLVVLTLGTGLGGGWVNKGALFNGYNGNAMEAGHVTIVKDGAKCGCGKNGCAESYFSATGLINRFSEVSNKTVANVSEIFSLAMSGDKIAQNTIFFGVEILAELVKSIIHLINPDRVVFVGGLTKSWDFYSPELIKKVREIVFPVFSDYVKIEKGSGVAGSYGAAALCFRGMK